MFLKMSFFNKQAKSLQNDQERCFIPVQNLSLKYKKHNPTPSPMFLHQPSKHTNIIRVNLFGAIVCFYLLCIIRGHVKTITVN